MTDNKYTWLDTTVMQRVWIVFLLALLAKHHEMFVLYFHIPFTHIRRFLQNVKLPRYHHPEWTLAGSWVSGATCSGPLREDLPLDLMSILRLWTVWQHNGIPPVLRKLNCGNTLPMLSPNPASCDTLSLCCDIRNPVQPKSQSCELSQPTPQDDNTFCFVCLYAAYALWVFTVPRFPKTNRISVRNWFRIAKTVGSYSEAIIQWIVDLEVTTKIYHHTHIGLKFQTHY